MVGVNIGGKLPVKLGVIQIRTLVVKGCIRSPGVWLAAIRFLRRTGLDLSPIQTHQFGLSEAVEAFHLGDDAQACIKVALLAA